MIRRGAGIGAFGTCLKLTETRNGTARFNEERIRIKVDHTVAVGLTLAVGAWMATGLISGEDSTAAPNAPAGNPAREAEQRRAVSVRMSEARPVTREIVVSGRSEPNRTVEISAETEGRVVSIDAERGARIAAGEQIVALDLRDRDAQVAEAEAIVKQRELEYEAAQRLQRQDYMSETQVAQAEAQLATARAALQRARLDLSRTSITAPFDGMLQDREVEIGDFVGVGDPIGTFVDTDPLVVVGDVSETEIYELGIGTHGEAELVSGETVTGEVRYVAPVAADSTRTFRIELAIPNPEGAYRAGMSAEMQLPAGEIVAHKLSPALLTLDDEGRIGVKTVDSLDTVRFFPVEIVRSGEDGLWVTGLAERARVITVGQGFVAAGQVVEPVPAERAARISEITDGTSPAQ